MSLTNTVSAERVHIGFFGRRNAGKSSVVNAVTGQSLSVVSDVKGTTTDVVQKAMELLPLGPVVILDTPGIDDEGKLGEMRVAATQKALQKTDIAVLVIDAAEGISEADKALEEQFLQKKIPYLVVFNKSDLLEALPATKENVLYVSAKDKTNIETVKEKLAAFAKGVTKDKKILSDLVRKGDQVILVMPIDEAAPKGRLILPQQQTLRELLDIGAIITCVQPEELQSALENMKQKPKLVITDSQVFGTVSEIVPDDIWLTSFSILFARYKGELETFVEGAARLKSLQDGDKVMISEGCTHHRQCNDIGTVKLPHWIETFTGVKPQFAFTSGGDFPSDLEDVTLVVHCGGCTLNEREMKSRMERARDAGVPITNYGIAIAEMHGILKRSLSPFPSLYEKL